MSHFRCDACKYYRTNTVEPDRGTCVRFPPASYPTGKGQITAFWPIVMGEQWCGEWTTRILSAHDADLSALRQ